MSVNSQTRQDVGIDSTTENGLIGSLLSDLMVAENCSLNDDRLVRIFSSPILDSPGYVFGDQQHQKDIFFEAVAELESECGNFVNTRVLLQTPYEARMAIGSTWDCDCFPIFDEQWHFEASGSEAFIERMLERGFNVVGPFNLLASLIDFDLPATHLSAPGIGTIPTPETLAAGHDHTHPRTVTDYDSSSLRIKTGHCPVCGYDAGDFGSLRGHIGGKIAHGCSEHERLNIRLDDYR